MNIKDKKDLQKRLARFAIGDTESYEITRHEAMYLTGLVNGDWRN